MGSTKAVLACILSMAVARQSFPVLQAGHAAVQDPAGSGSSEVGRVTPQMLPDFNSITPQLYDRISGDWAALRPVSTTTKHSVRPQAGFVVPKYDGPPVDPSVARKIIEATPGFTFKSTHSKSNSQTDFYTAQLSSFIEESKVWLNKAEVEHTRMIEQDDLLHHFGIVKPIYDDDSTKNFRFKQTQDPTPASSSASTEAARLTPQYLPDFNDIAPQSTGRFGADWAALRPVEVTVHHSVHPQAGFVQPKYDGPSGIADAAVHRVVAWSTQRATLPDDTPTPEIRFKANATVHAKTMTHMNAQSVQYS